jgi:hypothetical protein
LEGNEKWREEVEGKGEYRKKMEGDENSIPPN